MPAPLDLTGKRFGRLFVIQADTSKKLRSWMCKCDCGKTTVIPTNKLTSGHTQSCGCIKAETTVTNGFKNKVHGRSRKRNDLTYRSWTSMRERCRKHYKDKAGYWGRGITICERWDSFENFVIDMGERPVGTTLDRIDVNGNYEPSNCRWATAKEQQRNRRNTRYLYFKGERRSAMEVAEDLGVKKSAMQYFVTVYRKMVNKYGFIPDIENSVSVDS